MKKGVALWIVFVFAFAGAAFAATATMQQAAPVQSVMKTVAEPAYNDGWVDVFPVEMESSWRDGRHTIDGHLDVFDSTVVIDDMEGGFPAWTSADLSAGIYWMLHDTLTYNPPGLSWVCADTCMASPGYAFGYDNHWLQYLISDTMDFTSTSSPRLQFKARWKIEVPDTHSEPGCLYDMWDGWNVWGSTDGGANWSVLDPVTPPYTGTSSFAFGYEWDMGCNIPAYGGTDYADAFTDCIFDLSSLNGYGDVLVRWAFCSDPAWCSTDDPSFYGVIIDEIQVTDGATPIWTNSGSLDEIALDQGPIAEDVWVYHEEYDPPSPTHCWTATMPAYNSARGLYSHPIALPTGYDRLSIRYYVWCDMPDSDGDGDNSLEDYYYVMIAEDDPCAVYEMVVYDYGYYDGSEPPGGNSLLGWVERRGGLTSGGTHQSYIDITDWAGQTVRLAFRHITDANDDGGIGTGLHIDDVQVVATRAFADDLAGRNLIVPFPTTVGLEQTFQYDVINEGLNNQGTLIRSEYWVYDPTGAVEQTATPYYTGTVLEPGDDTTFYMAWTPAMVGSYFLEARSNLTRDQDTSNDTTSTPINEPLNPDSNLAVTVRPAGEYELAYHTRHMVNAFLNPRYVRYTPEADGVPSSTANAYDITTVRVMWSYDAELADTGATVWIEFWEPGPDPDHYGAIINRIETEIDTSETVGLLGKEHWWTLDVTGTPGLQNRAGNFWVSLTAKDSIGGGLYPHPLGESVDPVVYDGHHFVIRLDTVGTPLNPSPGRYLLQTTIEPAANTNPPSPVDSLVIKKEDGQANVILNWGPTANATGYHVYRLTSPFQDYTTGTKLTLLPLTVTTYTDVGAVAAGTKLFYVVVGIN
jgi:hypothetical protein